MRILMFHRGGQSGSIESLLQQWRLHYPDVEVRTVDLYRELFGSRWRKVMAVPRALRCGGMRALRPGRGAWMDALRHTLWLSRQLTRRAGEIQRCEQADASLSFGTTYDAAWEERPHFVYTDLTILANLYYPDGAEALQPWLAWLPCEHEALRRASMVFTHSALARRSIVEQYALPAEQALNVRCGSNVPVPGAADPQRYERRNILFVGLDWERKGGPQLVEAFEHVRRQVPDATLTVVGCKPRVRQAGVDIVGAVPLDHVGRYMGQASVFCMPSLREPFGYVYLEAMQAGLPVVAARRGPAPEFVHDGENGFTVEPRDHGELAARLVQLLDDPSLCRELGRRGQRLVETEYNWTRTCRDMTTAISGVLATCR